MDGWMQEVSGKALYILQLRTATDLFIYLFLIAYDDLFFKTVNRCGVPVGAKVLAGSSAAEPGEPGADANADADAEVAAGNDGTVEGKGNRGKRGRGRGGAAAAAGSVRSTEIVPHFPHIGRVARYCEVPVSGVQGSWKVLGRFLEGSLIARSLCSADRLYMGVYVVLHT